MIHFDLCGCPRQLPNRPTISNLSNAAMHRDSGTLPIRPPQPRHLTTAPVTCDPTGSFHRPYQRLQRIL